MADALRIPESVKVERQVRHDVFTGPVVAMLAAGIIEQRHLEPQPRRHRGWTGFMPDGSPLPEGAPPPAYLPGAFSVKLLPTGLCEVRRGVSVDEARQREAAQPALTYKYKHSSSYRGTREQLLREGIPERWMENVIKPGKVRGRRTFYEGEQKIEVSVGEADRFWLEVTHIDYYRSMGEERYQAVRAQWGLPPLAARVPIQKGGLSLAWSAPSTTPAR